MCHGSSSLVGIKPSSQVSACPMVVTTTTCYRGDWQRK